MNWLIFLLIFCVGLYFGVPLMLRALIRRRLRGYEHTAVSPVAGHPQQLSGAPRSVAVVGSGVAGLTAALTLARRGFIVTVFEKNNYLGGKLGSFEVELESGRSVWVSHGFHAFFRHYKNLNRFLDSLNLRKGFVEIDDYLIVGKDGRALRFAGLDTTPVFNLFALMKAGMFSLGDALKAPGRDLYGLLLEYEEQETFEKYDGMSYAEFARRAQVPPRLKLAFNTFARAFFADEEKLSLAELIKSFHFYYLSHDGGLIYDYPEQDYEAAFLAPIRDELKNLGGTIHMETPVQQLERQSEGFLVNGSAFDKVVLAPDVGGVQKVMGAAVGFPESAQAPLAAMRPGQRYAVVRLWLDQDVREGLPVFFITERRRLLDSVTTFHRFEHEAKEDLKQQQAAGSPLASIVELHCYAVPDDTPDERIFDDLWADVQECCEELKGATILDSHLEVRQDFTAFHVGCYAQRPGTDVGVPGFYTAGDWVKLPFPAMLLEGACASGLLAANAICREEGLAEEEVLSVPLQGLMTGVPAPPTRKKLLGIG